MLVAFSSGAAGKAPKIHIIFSQHLVSVSDPIVQGRDNSKSE
jgi:hypothetical protein